MSLSATVPPRRRIANARSAQPVGKADTAQAASSGNRFPEARATAHPQPVVYALPTSGTQPGGKARSSGRAQSTSHGWPAAAHMWPSPAGTTACDSGLAGLRERLLARVVPGSGEESDRRELALVARVAAEDAAAYQGCVADGDQSEDCTPGFGRAGRRRLGGWAVQAGRR